MPDGKNITKQPFIANLLCVIFSFGISEHEVPGTWNFRAWRPCNVKNFGMWELRNVLIRPIGYRFSKKICLLLGHVIFLFVCGTITQFLAPYLAHVFTLTIFVFFGLCYQWLFNDYISIICHFIIWHFYFLPIAFFTIWHFHLPALLPSGIFRFWRLKSIPAL